MPSNGACNTLIDYAEAQMDGFTIYDFMNYPSDSEPLGYSDFDGWLHMKMSGSGISLDVATLKKVFFTELITKIRVDAIPGGTEKDKQLTYESILKGLYRNALDGENEGHEIVENFLEAILRSGIYA